MLRVRNPAGENITPEVNVQTPLIEDITEALVGKVYGANATPETILKGYSAYVHQELVEGVYEPKGLYVWEKLDKKESIEVSSITTTSTGATITLKNPPNPLNSTILNGGKMTIMQNSTEVGTYTFILDEYGMFEAEFKGSGNYGGRASISESKIQVANSGINVLSNLSATSIIFEEILIGYVVSDDSNAYPDGGYIGGYYYEQISEESSLLKIFGCSTMKIDKITFSSAVGTIGINHSLGTIPKYAILSCADTAPTTGNGLYVDLIMSKIFVHNRLNNGVIVQGASGTVSSITETAISHSSINGNVFAGIEYTLITMA